MRQNIWSKYILGYFKVLRENDMECAWERKWLENSFKSFFGNHDYTELTPVSVTSRVDPTVYLVNSATNLFKRFIHKDPVRVFTIQRSMRTQILQNYYSKEAETEYPSCFDSLGVYVTPDYLQDLINDTISFFSSIGFDIAHMRIRASSEDPLLIKAASMSIIGNSIILDDRSSKYHHLYGGELSGRAIKLDYFQEWQQKYKNLCYFILIYENGIAQGVEMATSDQLILMRLRNAQYAISVAAISNYVPTNTFDERRFADSIVGAAVLIAEGLHPNSSNTNGRTLKKYLKATSYFGERLSIGKQGCVQLICEYACNELLVKLDNQTVLSYLHSNPHVSI